MKLDFIALGIGIRFLELAEDSHDDELPSKASNFSAKSEGSGQKKYLVRMLAAYMDLGGKLHMQGDSIDLDAQLKGLRLETLMELDQNASLTQATNGIILFLMTLCTLEETMHGRGVIASAI